jgi:nucleotide-binding universal stress UspA family protein
LEYKTNPIHNPGPRVTAPQHILVPLDGSEFAERALPTVEMLCRAFDAQITLASVIPNKSPLGSNLLIKAKFKRMQSQRESIETYLQKTKQRLTEKGLLADYVMLTGPIAESLNNYASENGTDMLVICTHGRSGIQRWLQGSIANRIIQLILKPVLILRPRRDEIHPVPEYKRLLVSLDGSEFAERVLPWVRASTQFDSQVLLLHVPEVPEAEEFGAMVEEIEALRKQAEEQAMEYLTRIASELEEEGIQTRVIIKGSRPAETIVSVAREEEADVILLATHGRGGMDRLFMGSVADRVIQYSHRPVFLVPIRERRLNNQKSPPKE